MESTTAVEDGIELKNGSREAAPVVAMTYGVLCQLWEKGIETMCSVYELMERCRDSGYEIEPGALEILKEHKLVEDDGSIHSSIRNVVISATDGEGGNTALCDPVKR